MKELLILFLAMISASLWAETNSFIQVEGALVYQTRNDQRIPGVGGTQFDLSDFDQGPFEALRLYVGKQFNERHEIRALFAPFEANIKATLPGTVLFNGTTFSAGSADAFYKFNSYRLTYAYHFPSINSWTFALGGTAKIRQAEVRLSQGSSISSKKNIGFVPLLNAQAKNQLSPNWIFRIDLDGLAAPQGRAFDVAFLLDYKLQKSFSVLAGYRMVEGGADNDKVYNFAWLHYATVGLRGDF